MLKVLTPKVASCSRELKAQEVSNALYGLKSLGDSKEVRGMLKVLTPKVASCSEELDTQAMANALAGLKSLKSSAEMRGLVKVLTPKLRLAGKAGRREDRRRSALF